PGAKSVIALAASYEGNAGIERPGQRVVSVKSCGELDKQPLTPALSPWEGEREDRSESDAEATSLETQDAQPGRKAGVKGFIARYTRYSDYHDVIGEQLRKLVSFLGQLAGPHTKSLWYVDTGPLLERDLAQRAGLGFIGKHTNLISRKLGN